MSVEFFDVEDVFFIFVFLYFAVRDGFFRASVCGSKVMYCPCRFRCPCRLGSIKDNSGNSRCWLSDVRFLFLMTCFFSSFLSFCLWWRIGFRYEYRRNIRR